MSQVRIINGSYCGNHVHNQIFEMVHPIKEGKKGPFITVKPAHGHGLNREKIRINVAHCDVEHIDIPKVVESDEQVMERIGERFQILEEMTKATISSDIRAMIVVGPPGVGKSYGVEQQLEKANLFTTVQGLPPKYEVVKGAMTPIGLYSTLYRHSDKGNVLVFDDCDSVLMDDLSLNILKAALDSGKKRTIYWNADSHLLRRDGIPDKFDFKGSVVFITNLKFDNLKSKKLQDHLEALQSRCHYLDLTLNTMRDKFLRVKQIANTGKLFQDYNFQNGEDIMVIDFIDENKDKLREMSLRMALKIADLVKISRTNWQALARTTCMKNSF